LKYGDPLFGKPARKFKPRKTRVYNRYGLKAVHAVHGHGLAQPGPYIKTRYRESILGLFGRKKFVLGIIVLALILGGIGFYADPTNGVFHSYTCDKNTKDWGPGYCGDPVTTIWTATSPNNDLSEFNSVQSVWGGGTKSIDLESNGTQAAVALSKSPVGDLSIVSAKEMFLRVEYQLNTCCGAAGEYFGVYLTTNKTLPTQLRYDPFNDASVSLLLRFDATSGHPNNLYFQRDIGQSIGSRDFGCGASGTCYTGTGDNIDPTTTFTTVGAVLNFTTQGNLAGGCIGGTGGPGCSEVAVGPTTNVPPTFNSWSQQIPWFRFQTEQYYIGFYSLAGNTGFIPLFYFEQTNNSPSSNTFHPMDIAYYVPGPGCSGQSSGPCNPDTGGFFGPVLKFLISGVVWIFQSLISFSTFLYTLYIAALNLLGGWIGLSGVGTNLDSFLRAFVQFMGQMASIIANLGSGITVLINDISFGATFIVGLLTTTASWLSAAVLLGGKLKQIFDLVFRYGNNMLWIFFWSTFFLYTATGEGWSGTLEFFNAANWASSLGANFVIRMVNFGVQAIAFLKGFIPTEAGAPPPTSPVSEGGKPAGASLQSTAKPILAQPSRFKAGFSRANITRARGATATKFKLSAARPAAPSFSAALEWDPIKVILLLGGLLLLMLWIGGGLSPFGAASATCTSTTAPTAGNTARCFQTSYDILSQITAPILLMFASIGSITFLADKFGMIGSTFSGPATFRAIPRSHVKQRRELMKLRRREKQLRMEFRK